MHPILFKLADGDRRSIGRSEEVAAEIATDPLLFGIVFDGMLHGEAVVRMRAADAVEKATRTRPELLHPHKPALLGAVASSGQQEVRWHAAQMLPRLTLNDAERDAALAVLESYLSDRSRIVQTNAMQGLADFARKDDRLRPRVVTLLEAATATGSAAMRARGRKLLTALCPGDEA